MDQELNKINELTEALNALSAAQNDPDVKDKIMAVDMAMCKIASAIIHDDQVVADFIRNPVSSHKYYVAYKVMYGVEKAVEVLGEARSNFDHEANNG